MITLLLTPRLETIKNMVSYRTVADIGTDHGKLAVALITEGKADKMIAGDLADGPLAACRKTAQQYGVSDKIDVRKGDGLRILQPFEAETVVIAGMGGELIAQILGDNVRVAKSAKELLLQPMTSVSELRTYLASHCYEITQEMLVREQEKFYHILRVRSVDVPVLLSKLDCRLPKLLLKNERSVLQAYLEKERMRLNRQLTGLEKAKNVDAAQLKWIRQVLARLEEMLLCE